MKSCCRNDADAQLQATVAQHASDCKQQLSSSTAEVEVILASIADDKVMQLEEDGVHEVHNLDVQQIASLLRLLVCPTCAHSIN